MPVPPPLYCGIFNVAPVKVAAPLVPVVVSVILFCFVANLVVRLSKVVSVSSIITVRSAETVPVVVIGLGDTIMPVPAVIEVRLPDPLPFAILEPLPRIRETEIPTPPPDADKRISSALVNPIPLGNIVGNYFVG